MSLHDSVRDEGCRYLSSTKPTAIESLNGLFGIFDSIKFDINLALRTVNDKQKKWTSGLTCVSFSTLIAVTGPYLLSHSPLTSSARSLSQSRSVSLIARRESQIHGQLISRKTDSSGSNIFFNKTERDCIAWGMFGLALHFMSVKLRKNK